MRWILRVWLGALCAAPCAAQVERGDRWQLTLDSGRILWDLHLVRLAGDTLVVRHADSTFVFTIGQLDELRLVQKSKRSITPEAGRYGGVLGGADERPPAPGEPVATRRERYVPPLPKGEGVRG